MRFKYLNKSILIVVILVCVSSIFTLASLHSQQSGTTYARDQLFGIILGFIIIGLIYFVDLQKAEKLINIAYYILYAMLFILAIDLPFLREVLTHNVNGATGWFIIPGVGTIQPVEFMKIALFFKMAIVSHKHIENNSSDVELLKKYFIYAGIPIGLVFVQPDMGGVMLLSLPVIVLFLISIQSKKVLFTILFILAISSIILGSLILIPQGQELLIKYTPIQFYQLERFDSWLNPFESAKGFQLTQSLTMIGSAGKFGHGFGYSTIYLPEPHTDVIFSEFVGTFGWIAGALLIAGYFYLINSILSIAKNTEIIKYKLLAIAFSTLFMAQIFENIGMMIGLFPITGIVLPFMSYGNSAMITFLAIIGIVIKIDYDSKILKTNM